MAKEKQDEFTRDWIIRNALEIIPTYERGVLTIRGLHYRLVARGMTNTIQHYKRVVAAMTVARWDGRVHFLTFSDNDRDVIGSTSARETVLEDKIDEAERQIDLWMRIYSKNRWENQPIYPEVFIEKKALQGVFESVTSRKRVALSPCKGYPSLTFLYDAAQRLKHQMNNGKTPVILYFGDYDPSGEDIPRSIKANLSDMGVEVEVRRVALMEEQVVEWKLPPAPAKVTDSRTATWDGLGQVELDAVEPKKLQSLVSDAIDSLFDIKLHEDLMDQERAEEIIYKRRLKDFVMEIDTDSDEDEEDEDE